MSELTQIDRATIDRLEAPFGRTDLDWKVQRSGVKKDGEVWAVIVPYIDARAAQRRLDEVFGLDGWEVTYREIDLGSKLFYDKEAKGKITREIRGVIATLKFRLPGTERWVTREDGAEPTDVEPVKGGISSAFKRVVVTIGIGRYLYDVDAMFANIVEKGPRRGTAKYKNNGRDDRLDFCWEPRLEDVMKLTGKPAPAPAKAPAGKDPVAPKAEQVTADVPAGEVPPCPECGGKMVDLRPGKRNPKAPDFRCKGAKCNGAIFPVRAMEGAA